MIKIKNGFHLIELMVVLLCVCLVTTFAIPLYTHYFQVEKRLAAAQALSKLAVSLEQYGLEHDGYLDATLHNLHFPKFIQAAYQLSLKVTADTYTLEATPIKQQTQDACGTLILLFTGERRVTGTNKVASCW